MESEPVLQRVLRIDLRSWMQIFSVCRRRNASRDRLSWSFRGITSTGIMRNRKGYSGTAVFTKKEPLSVVNGIGIEEHDKEGRVITLEFEEFYFVTVYTPNSQSELRRLEYRMEWERDFLAYLAEIAGKEACDLLW